MPAPRFPPGLLSAPLCLQVSFYDRKAVRKTKVEKRNNDTVNRLNRTKREEYPDLAARRETHDQASRCLPPVPAVAAVMIYLAGGSAAAAAAAAADRTAPELREHQCTTLRRESDIHHLNNTCSFRRRSVQCARQSCRSSAMQKRRRGRRPAATATCDPTPPSCRRAFSHACGPPAEWISMPGLTAFGLGFLECLCTLRVTWLNYSY